jgi:hypothetical protein
LEQGAKKSAEAGGGIEAFAGVISSVDHISAFCATRMIPIFQKIGENSDKYKKGTIFCTLPKEMAIKGLER